ncbi:MAG: hypothetical protein CME68_10275 [Halobacteriovoraceae bacterium]|nr:hypothetical protein [Halobacteriovoraceae bacterium]
MSSDDGFSISLKENYIKIHLGYFIPDIKIPLALYLPFKGKVIEVVKAGTPGSLDFFKRMKSNGIYYVYVKKTDQSVWDNWKKVRHPEIEGFKDFSEGPANKIKSNIAIYKARAFEKVRIVPSLYKDPESYLEEVDKKYHKVLSESQLIWFFNETWSESHFLFSAKLSLFFFLFLEEVRSELMIYDEMSILTFSLVHNLVSQGMINDFKGKPEDSTIYYVGKKDIVLDNEIKNLFQLHKQFSEMKRETNFKFDPSMPKGYQVFSLLRDFIEIFDRSKIDIQKRQEGSFQLVGREKRYEVSLIGHLERVLKKVKLLP